MKRNAWTWLGFLVLLIAVAMMGDTFVRAFQQDGEAPIHLSRFLPYLLGNLVQLGLLWALAWAHYRFAFRVFYQNPTYPLQGLYPGLLGLLGLLLLLFFQWRTDFDPAYGDENVLLSLLLLAFIMAYAFFFDYLRTRREQLQLRKEKTEAELQVLQAQIKPHFLFNTLNTIFNSALQHEDEATANLVSKLSNLLRFSIKDARQEFISIAQEIVFLEAYLDLQKARLPISEKLKIECTFDVAARQQLISPLLLIPFVENAFQYGISLEQPCFVAIGLKVEQEELVFNIKNSVPSHKTVQAGHGTGIANVRQRLNLLYPQQHTLNIVEQAGVFEVQLSIQLKTP
jgi:Histidine kinase